MHLCRTGSERVLIPRRRFHRTVFLLAGIYNIGWGIFSAVDPQWLFRFAGMPLSPYPEIFAWLAMVVGLYGILYLEVARRPERGWLIAAVGLAAARRLCSATATVAPRAPAEP